jgi:tetratricopeptide (TPR) repeat protein
MARNSGTRRNTAAAAALAGVALLLIASGAPSPEDQLFRHRNLGKAFYENPATHAQAIDEFRKALALAPGSARERLNYGLALLRGGKVDEGAAELEKVQQADPKLPHTWFNLGIAYKQRGEQERALRQFQRMVELVPGEPVSHYNLGALHRAAGETARAIAAFETAARLDPNLAAPRFQLYNLYRQAGRTADAARELDIFKRLKQEQQDAAVPEDMNWSWYAEIYDPIDPQPPQNAAVPSSYEDRVLAGGFGRSSGLALIAWDAAGNPDLVAWSGSGVRLFRSGSAEVKSAGLNRLKEVVAVAPGDYNNDGAADLAVVSSSGVTLYGNRNGAFRETAQLSSQRFAAAVWLDYDHDYDLDLFLLGEKSALLRNQGEAGFRDVTAQFPFEPGRAIAATPFELLHDTPGFDLAVSYADRPGVLYRDRLAGRYEPAQLPALPPGAQSLETLDANRDGSMDLAAVAGGAPLLLLNRKGALARAAAPPELRPRTVAADFDRDGREDRARIAEDGKLHLLRNATANSGNWLAVRLAGVKNLQLAPNAKVEVKAGASYQKRVYQGVPLLFPLGGHEQVDTVRVTWPNGLIQNETRQAVNRMIAIKEAPRLAGSCPMVFTWNGARFEFITDVLGVAPLGAASGDGTYFAVDHDEYVFIESESLKPRGGRYEVRLTEELREVSYIDQVRLIALDHPAGTQIVTNEKFQGPPYPEFRLFGVKRRMYPLAARDHRGSDVRARLAARDAAYVDGFSRDLSGRAEMHYLELDFGKAATANQAVLILNGWVDWADGSIFAAAAQEGKELLMPRLQVKDTEGQWRTVIDDMGIPAGKPKTIAVDLSRKFLSSSREIRIATNLCVYWDEVFLSEDAAPPEARLHDLAMTRAELRFRGFSRPIIHPQRKQPETFDYSVISAVSNWNPTRGLYTRYGDVRPLLAGIDDHFVVFGSGDELSLSFTADAAPPPPGWQRDFLLFVDGWAKDGDASTAFSQTVEPLPFHAMSSYPYPAGERYPHRAELNTRPALRLLLPLVNH